MKPHPSHDEKRPPISRRRFFQLGGAAVAAGALPLSPARAADEGPGEGDAPAKITRFRTLGRTGFRVSDIGIGCAGVTEANLIRYAYDRGVNYFDTAESYGNGASERAIGGAMSHIDRKRIFLTTKVLVEEKDDAETITERFRKCQERLKTDTVDALYLHAVEDVRLEDHEGFHAAVRRLRADGSLRFAGISSHGPRSEDGDSMEKVLTAAAESGRFDLMLFSYNFLNKEEAERVLAACKKKNVGTTAMKVVPGTIGFGPYDAENPRKEYEEYIESAAGRGVSREEAIERINAWARRQKEKEKAIRPFLDKHGIRENDELRRRSVQWVLANDDMHTVCVSMKDFEDVDRIAALSGTELSDAGRRYLRDWRYAYGDRYCRHGCVRCMPRCPENVPVSTVMRYAYYFKMQGREKHAMAKYARLGKGGASPCLTCAAPCQGACPHGVDVPASMAGAHMMLTLA